MSKEVTARTKAFEKEHISYRKEIRELAQHLREETEQNILLKKQTTELISKVDFLNEKIEKISNLSNLSKEEIESLCYSSQRVEDLSSLLKKVGYLVGVEM